MTSAMAKSPQLAVTADQQAKERSILLAILVDSVIIVAMVQIGLMGGSFTMLAEAVRATLMLIIEIFSFVVMRRIHRGVLRGFEFGPGKLEQVASLAIAVGMFAGAIWIAFGVLHILAGERPLGTPLGLTLAAMLGAFNTWVNIVAWDVMRRAARTGGSVIMRAQLSSRTVKLFSSLFVQATMTVAAISQNDVIVAWADAIGSGVVAIFIVVNAVQMMRSGLPDLLDRTLDEGIQIAINRALARHFKDYDHIDRVRSRRAGEKVFIEIALRVDGNLALGEADDRAEALRATLNEEIRRADVSVDAEIIVLSLASPLRAADSQSGELDTSAVLIMSARGRLDVVAATDLQRRFSASIERGESKFLLDLSGLTNISSAGLRVLLAVAKRVEAGEGQLAICGLCENVASMFKASGFDAVIAIFPDKRAALASYA